jgi:hypothetical protein
MPYTLYNSDGTQFGTTGQIADGTADGPGFASTTTNLVLPGPNFVGYGGYLNQNLINLLENFAAQSAPSAGPNVIGQLWYDTYNKVLKVYQDNVNGYVDVSGIELDNQQPLITYKAGTLLYRTDLNQVFIYDADGNTNLIGPQYTSTQGTSGAIPLVLQDANVTGLTHNVISLQFGSQIFAIVSDATFTPQNTIAGFARIAKGINYNSALSADSNLNINVLGNLIGNVTGSVSGNLTGNVVGNLTGSVLGNLTGNVVGNVTGNVVGNVTGNVVATTAQIVSASVTNVSTGNAQITGGNVNATNLEAQTLTVNGLTTLVGTTVANTINAITIGNSGATLTGTLSSGSQNLITSATGLTNVVSVAGNIATLSSYLATISNFSSPNVLITGGAISGISSLSGTSLNISGAVNLAGTTTASTLNVSSLQVSGGISGTLTSGAQNAITSATALSAVGTLSSGTWQASVIQPTYGGTGVNNGSNTLTLRNSSWVLDQSVASGESPNFQGTNFSGVAASLTAGAVTNGVYTTSTYRDPSFISTLNWNKLIGTAPNISIFPNNVGYLTSAPAVGVGQSYQDVTLSRNPHTTYTNNTGNPIQVIITYNVTFNGFADAWVDVNGVTVAHAGFSTGNGTLPQGFATIPLTFIVPNGATYIAWGYVGYNRWVELR